MTSRSDNDLRTEALVFYEEDMERLCPLDVSRSEIWGAAVVFCRYVCAPKAPP